MPPYYSFEFRAVFRLQLLSVKAPDYLRANVNQKGYAMTSLAMFEEEPDRPIRASEFLLALAELCKGRSDRTFANGLEELLRRKIADPPRFRPATDGARHASSRLEENCTSPIDYGIDRRQSPKSFPMETRSYAPKQIADLEGVKPSTVRGWINDKKLRSVPDPHRKAGPRARHVILAEDYERFKRGEH
jgi:hypothetical protein